jgi:hypothetical protein
VLLLEPPKACQMNRGLNAVSTSTAECKPANVEELMSRQALGSDF